MKFSTDVPKHGMLIIAVLLFCCWTAVLNVSTKEISPALDANVYMYMAYHIHHDHAVCEGKWKKPFVTNRREPGYPIYLASMMAMNPKLAAVDIKNLTKPEGGLIMFRYTQIPILLGIALCAWILTFLITKRYLLPMGRLPRHIFLYLTARGYCGIVVVSMTQRTHTLHPKIRTWFRHWIRCFQVAR